MGRAKIFHYVFTGLLTVMMLLSAGMYVFKYADVAATFSALDYPTYLVYPLAIAKVLAVLTLWIRPHRTLVGLAYAGLFYDFVLALVAHLVVGDGDFPGAIIALVLLGGSFFTRPDR